MATQCGAAPEGTERPFNDLLRRLSLSDFALMGPHRNSAIQPGRNRATVIGMSGAALHVVFDIAAWLAAGAAAFWLSRARHLRFPGQSFALP